MIRHLFTVKEHRPKMAFAGTPQQRDSGDVWLVLESASPGSNVGKAEFALSAKDAGSFPVDGIVSIEIRRPPALPGHAMEPDVIEKAPGA